MACCATRPGPSRVKPFGPEVDERIVALTPDEPPGETTRWTGRAMAKAAGESLSYVQRLALAWTSAASHAITSAPSTSRAMRWPRLMSTL